MSLNGVVEFCVHIQKFKNIDLSHQGLYHIRLSFYYEVDDQKIYAFPYLKREMIVKDTKKKATCVIDSHVFKQSSAYVTKTFLIRFVDEEVELNECCQFRTEFEVAGDITPPTFYMEAELMFSDLSRLDQVKTLESSYASFKCISVFKATIKNTVKGVNEYVPFLFDDTSFCVLHTTLHAAVLDIGFVSKRSSFLTKQPSLEESKEKKPQQPTPPFPTKDFTTFLSERTHNFKINELEDFYHRYVKPLKISHDNLIKFCNTVIQLTSSNKLNCQYNLTKPARPSSIVSENDSTRDTTNDENKNINIQDHEEESKVVDKTEELKKLLDEDKMRGYFLTKDSPMAVHAITKALNIMSGSTFQTWEKMTKTIMNCCQPVISYLREEYHRTLKNKWNESVFQKLHKIPDLALTYDPKIGENHAQIAKSKREALLKEAPLSVQDLSMFPKIEEQPIMFEEVCIKDIEGGISIDNVLQDVEKNQSRVSYKGVHLVVLCHGFQGSSYDLHAIRNNLSFLYPHTLFICSSANEELTEGEIASMGLRLATEVTTYVDEWVANNLSRLSFIGHSLGGLVIRAALPYLEKYASKMHLFMTLCTPHLGYMYSSSRLINAGIWVLKKWRKSKCLQELSLSDADEIQNSYLYKLSKAQGLNWFKNVVLISSYQDQYVPYESTRIQIPKQAAQDAKYFTMLIETLSNNRKGAHYAQMAKNLLSNISTPFIYRLDVNFNIVQKSLDSMIGRTAHIQFLESHVLMRMIMYRYPDFFW